MAIDPNKQQRRRTTTSQGPTNSSEVRKSRYNHARDGPVTSMGRFLDFYEKVPILEAEDDITFVIPHVFDGRADKISNHFYNSPRYMWVILMRNNIDDPFSELLPGNKIFIPSVTRLFSEILN